MSARLEGDTCDACGSARTALRRKQARNGSPMFAYQCLTCGASASSWIKRSAIKDADNLPEWDETLSGRYFRETREQRITDLLSERAADLAQWRSEHSAYLLTPKWRSIRARVLHRSRGICEGCGVSEASQVHHLTYDHWQNELLYELVALCDDCHECAHSARKAG